MDEIDLQLLAENPSWQRVLGTYAQLAAELQGSSAEEPTTGWNPRVASIKDVDSESLTEIHSQLIAFGWLKFQVEGRATGLMYRISPEGREALKALQNSAIGERAA